jgi:hypothetical protein
MFLVLALGSALVCPGTVASSERPKLVVYLHAAVKPRALESALGARLPAVEVVAYGRHRDFERALGQEPDGALALMPVLSAHSLEPHLRGVRGGATDEKYVLLSIATQFDKSRVPSSTLGVVELLGRERTARLVTARFGLPPPRELKYVVKTEDLLALLQFKSADAVLLAEFDADRLIERSKLDLRKTALSGRLGLVSVSFPTARGKRLIQAGIVGLDAETNQKMGVDSWR